MQKKAGCTNEDETATGSRNEDETAIGSRNEKEGGRRVEESTLVSREGIHANETQIGSKGSHVVVKSTNHMDISDLHESNATQLLDSVNPISSNFRSSLV